jgi:hypothetical protein
MTYSAFQTTEELKKLKPFLTNLLMHGYVTLPKAAGTSWAKLSQGIKCTGLRTGQRYTITLSGGGV